MELALRGVTLSQALCTRDLRQASEQGLAAGLVTYRAWQNGSGFSYLEDPQEDSGRFFQGESGFQTLSAYPTALPSLSLPGCHVGTLRGVSPRYWKVAQYFLLGTPQHSLSSVTLSLPGRHRQVEVKTIWAVAPDGDAMKKMTQGGGWWWGVWPGAPLQGSETGALFRQHASGEGSQWAWPCPQPGTLGGARASGRELTRLCPHLEAWHTCPPRTHRDPPTGFTDGHGAGQTVLNYCRCQRITSVMTRREK